MTALRARTRVRFWKLLVDLCERRLRRAYDDLVEREADDV
jgi:hypothetical protein